MNSGEAKNIIESSGIIVYFVVYYAGINERVGDDYNCYFLKEDAEARKHYIEDNLDGYNAIIAEKKIVRFEY